MIRHTLFRLDGLLGEVLILIQMFVSTSVIVE